jgi:hypothetical protein
MCPQCERIRNTGTNGYKVHFSKRRKANPFCVCKKSSVTESILFLAAFQTDFSSKEM